MVKIKKNYKYIEFLKFFNQLLFTDNHKLRNNILRHATFNDYYANGTLYKYFLYLAFATQTSHIYAWSDVCHVNPTTITKVIIPLSTPLSFPY